VVNIGCVSYLNAMPLVDGLEEEPGIRITSDVPSRLLDDLVNRRTSIALCPAIDYQTSPERLVVVPVGAIGSTSTTLTVRAFSRRPVDRVEHVAVDRDSHTSVALLRVVLAELYGIQPRLTSFNHDPTLAEAADDADAVLLIGDKAVASMPEISRFPHHIDLGDAWHRITGLPFVFATWMALPDTDLGDVPRTLRRRREANSSRIGEIVERHAVGRGWSRDLARHYLGSLLSYGIGQREIKAMGVFWEKCRQLGMIDALRPIRLYRNP